MKDINFFYNLECKESQGDCYMSQSRTWSLDLIKKINNIIY